MERHSPAFRVIVRQFAAAPGRRGNLLRSFGSCCSSRFVASNALGRRDLAARCVHPILRRFCAARLLLIFATAANIALIAIYLALSWKAGHPNTTFLKLHRSRRER